MNDVRPLREDLGHKHVLDFGVGVGAGVGEDEEAIVAVCGVAKGGENGATRGDTGKD